MNNDGLCIQEKIYSMVEMSMMFLLHMIAIHMKTNKDGKNVDQEVGEGSLRASTKC